jgi:hypothetical protein
MKRHPFRIKMILSAAVLLALPGGCDEDETDARRQERTVGTADEATATDVCVLPNAVESYGRCCDRPMDVAPSACAMSQANGLSVCECSSSAGKVRCEQTGEGMRCQCE